MYPRHEKLKANQYRAQAVYDFLEWLRLEYSAFICEQDDSGKLDHLFMSEHDLLAKWIGVDLTELEKERRALRGKLRNKK